MERFRESEEENMPNKLIVNCNTGKKPGDERGLMNEGPITKYVKQAVRIGGKLFVTGLD